MPLRMSVVIFVRAQYRPAGIAYLHAMPARGTSVIMHFPGWPAPARNAFGQFISLSERFAMSKVEMSIPSGIVESIPHVVDYKTFKTTLTPAEENALETMFHPARHVYYRHEVHHVHHLRYVHYEHKVHHVHVHRVDKNPASTRD